MATHIVSIVGRRMEAVLEVEAETEDQARELALSRVGELTEKDWYVADEIEPHSVERLHSKEEIAARGLKAW